MPAAASSVWAEAAAQLPEDAGRRAALGLLVVFFGDFLGFTERLASGVPAVGAAFQALRLDVLYPVGDLKRYYAPDAGFELRYPKAYLEDVTIARRAALRREAANPLDPPSLRAQKPRRTVAEPTAAFGPAGGSGETNISVIAAPAGPRALETFGGAEQQASWLLANVLAPEGSGKLASLLGASERTDEGGTLFYTFEYTLEKPGAFRARHNVAVFAQKGDTVYTLTAQAPQADWDDQLAAQFHAVAESFHLL